MKKILDVLTTSPAVRKITAFYEQTLWSVLHQVLPDATIKGCVYHWTQLAWKKVSWKRKVKRRVFHTWDKHQLSFGHHNHKQEKKWESCFTFKCGGQLSIWHHNFRGLMQMLSLCLTVPPDNVREWNWSTDPVIFHVHSVDIRKCLPGATLNQNVKQR